MQTRAVQDTAQCLVSDHFRLWAELVRQVVSEQSWPQRHDVLPLQRNFGPVGDSITSTSMAVGQAMSDRRNTSRRRGLPEIWPTSSDRLEEESLPEEL